MGLGLDLSAIDRVHHHHDVRLDLHQPAWRNHGLVGMKLHLGSPLELFAYEDTDVLSDSSEAPQPGKPMKRCETP